MTLKERIYNFRTKGQYINRSEFAKLCGIDRKTLYRVINELPVSEETIWKIEKVIGKEN